MALSSTCCTNASCLLLLLPMHLKLILLLLISSLCLFFHDGDASMLEGRSCMETERRALLAIKLDMYDPDRWLSSWKGPNCCGWRGVGCDNITGHVVKLDLRYPYDWDVQYERKKYYPGPSNVNPSLLHLIHLKHLDLSLNNFSGVPIPKFICSLEHLEYLNLSYSRFSGSIPHELGNLSSLHFLDIGWNGFYFYNSEWTSLRADSLRWLSNIPSLHLLDLSGLNLSKADNWLHEINMLPSLLELSLSDTDLPVASASISHFNLTSLTKLDLSWNYHLNATIPHWLFNISSLVHLDLGGCDFPDKLLFAIVDLHNLQFLDLSGNQITRELFHHLGNLSHLEHLYMSGNKISGEIPKSICKLHNLVELDLSDNKMTRESFQHLGNLSRLEYLQMDWNKLGGEIPKSIGNLIHLQVLYLWSNNISGEIPEIIGNLIHLEQLDLSENKISGEIPATIGNLIHLQLLDLSGNNISGDIPEIIGNLIHLEELDLSYNKISGEIPEIIENLIHLEKLDLSNNEISGEIPYLFDKLHSLHYLILYGNRITGNIQRFIESQCKLNILQGLDLSYNNISGEIPEILGQLSTLRYLDLSSNSFMGHMTEAHFANLTRLQSLGLSYNKVCLNHDWIPPFNAIYIGMDSCHLGPKFPTWLRTQTNLEELSLCENNILDSFPAWFWDLKIINYLNVSHNSMTGQLPTSLGGQQYEYFDVSSNNIHGLIPELDPFRLFNLILSNNSISGPIPLSFAKATNLEIFILSHNHVNGSIPQFLCNLPYLEVLDLSNNNMSGGVQLFSSSEASLEVLDLSNNEFSGELHYNWNKAREEVIDFQKDRKHSSKLMACPVNLQSLHVEKNRLSGNLPSWLKYCRRLVVLDFSENGFSGDLPIWIGEKLKSLRVLSLRSNFFNGSIPPQLSHLTSLQVLDLACNNFSGALPLSFGNFSAMMRIQNADKPMLSDFMNAYYTEGLLMTPKGFKIKYTSVLSLVMSIDLSFNNLSEMIPEELVNLRGLRFLNLSYNHFTGRIPENIGDLKQLEPLDLSMNNLSGIIPSTISSIYSLSHLNLSNNNLSGRIPWGNQLQTLCDPSIYSGNPNLRGWPLLGCFGDAPSKSPFPIRAQEVEPGNRDESEMIWLYAITALGFIAGLFRFIYVLMIKRAIRIAYFHLIDVVYDYIYVQFAMRFAKLKLILPTLMNNSQG